MLCEAHQEELWRDTKDEGARLTGHSRNEKKNAVFGELGTMARSLCEARITLCVLH